MEINARSIEGFQVEIQSGRHILISDEPETAGGQDQGPTPFALLLGALAACKLITVRMYAERKGWPLEDVNIRLKHEKIQAGEIQESVSSPDIKVDLIETEIEFRGDLSLEQMERLEQIANRCPVHRSVTSETVVRSKLVLSENVGG